VELLLFPSSPSELVPQQRTPVEVIAHVWAAPTWTEVTPVKPGTSSGTMLQVSLLLQVVVVVAPSWPLEFHPQHLTPPAVVTAQVWSSSAAIPAMPEAITSSATVLQETLQEPEVAVPSWPKSFAPQHFTAPVAVIAQV
jgi:hypothetical protein